jgi:hypothetical protein
MNIKIFAGLSAAALMALPMVAEAQGPRRAFELGLFGGYRVGGEILQEDNDFFPIDVDVDDSVAYGIRAEIPITDWVAIELLASRQPTEFIEDDDLFGPDASLLDVDITYYHVGVLMQWGPGQVRPFVVTSVGIGQINPDLPGLSTEERLSASVGGGVKVWANDHVGFRFEGRGYWTDIDDEEHDDRYRYRYDDDLYQFEVSAGLQFAF